MLWIGHTLVVLFVAKIYKHQIPLSHNQRPLRHHSIVFLGNSHIECAIDDRNSKEEILNLGKSAEPLFYSVVKAQKLIDNKLADTIVISFDNISVASIGWVLGEDRFMDNYKTYFADLEFQKHQFLWKQQPVKAGQSLAFLTLGNVKESANLNGGYLFLERDYISHPPTKSISSNPLPSNATNYNIQLQEQNTAALLQLLRENPTTTFFLIRTPFHEKVTLPNEMEYTTLVNKITSLENTRYIDCKNTPLIADSCFGDYDHLNYKGAKLFTPFIVELLRSNIQNDYTIFSPTYTLNPTPSSLP